MITWLQNTFGKHHRLLFSILLAIVIVTFVLTIGPQSFFGGRSEQEIKQLNFFGYDLASQTVVGKLMTSAQLSSYLNPKDTTLFRNRTEDYFAARTCALGLANEMGIPQPTKEQFDSFLRGRSAFAGEDGLFSQEKFSQFHDAVQTSGRFTAEDVVKTLVEDWRVDQVVSSIGGPGFILPYEALKQYEVQNTAWALDVASSDYNAYKPEIADDPAADQQFYDANPSRYEISVMAKAASVEFTIETFLPRVPEPDEATVAAYFEKNKPRFQKAPPPPKEGEPAPEKLETTLEEVRPEVVKAVKDEAARKLAAEAADTFSYQLYREKIGKGSPAFFAAIDQHEGILTDLPPYPKTQLPFQTGIPGKALTLVFDMNDKDYYSESQRTRFGVSVLIYETLIPSRIPFYEEIAAKVSADRKEEERKRLFLEEGRRTRLALIEALSANPDFSAVAKEKGLEVKNYEAFTLENLPSGLDYQTFTQAEAAKAGEVTEMAFRNNRGFFVFVRQKEVPQVAKDSPQVSENMTKMREMAHLFSAWLFLAEYSGRELEKLNPPKHLLQ